MDFELKFDIESNQNLDLIRQCNVPLAFIHSMNDELIPVNRFEELK